MILALGGNNPASLVSSHLAPSSRLGLAGSINVPKVLAQFSFVGIRPAAGHIVLPSNHRILNTSGAPVGPVTSYIFADPGVGVIPNAGQLVDLTGAPIVAGALPTLKSSYVVGNLAALPAGATALRTDYMAQSLANNASIGNTAIPSASVRLAPGFLFAMFLETANQDISLAWIYVIEQLEIAPGAST